MMCMIPIRTWLDSAKFFWRNGKWLWNIFENMKDIDKLEHFKKVETKSHTEDFILSMLPEFWVISAPHSHSAGPINEAE